MLKKLIMLSACTASAFALHTAEININNKDLEVGALFDMGQFNDTVEPNTIFVGGKFLNADSEHSEYTNAKIDPLLEANVLMMKEVGNSNFKIGIGAKLNYTQYGSLDFVSIPLGVEGTYTIATQEFIPMHLNAAVYYAPQVLTFKDAKNYLETRVSFDLEVIQNGNITVGYRKIETNYDVMYGDFRYNRSAYLGFKLKF
ncbi:YfaZ family outer membrane protein [Sulfurimonas sp. C5]|uniref:YfaZ family outer membrane protein n=1 Tax=Sulfurimonas sp. C5 TaxID=3036947 RepID=UPI0024579046|nr:YfaZ family outer membrane protein [Sulfurimonas sp. C5]MDH4945451.1 YfaZ family outer membrane protein [Sulfurimonas sp. C5]